MLLFVQLVQIARAKTTYESMIGNIHHASYASEAITSALVSGTTSMEGAQLANPAKPGHQSDNHPHKEGCFAQWKKLLGLDTFIATAGLDGKNRRGRRNPFSRGIITNCQDFWGDPAPCFGKRENGAAMLDGDVVNYTRMYEVPPRMKIHRSRGNGDSGTYHSVDSEDAV